MKNVRKVPMRTCVITNEVLPKKELVRVAATKDGLVSVDLTGKAHGRGAYLKLDKNVILKAKTSKMLNKKLKVVVDDSIYEELLGLLNE